MENKTPKTPTKIKSCQGKRTMPPIENWSIGLTFHLEDHLDDMFAIKRCGLMKCICRPTMKSVYYFKSYDLCLSWTFKLDTNKQIDRQDKNIININLRHNNATLGQQIVKAVRRYACFKVWHFFSHRISQSFHLINNATGSFFYSTNCSGTKGHFYFLTPALCFLVKNHVHLCLSYELHLRPCQNGSHSLIKHELAIFSKSHIAEERWIFTLILMVKRLIDLCKLCRPISEISLRSPLIRGLPCLFYIHLKRKLPL